MPELPEVEVTKNIIASYNLVSIVRVESKKINRYLDYNLNGVNENKIISIVRNGKAIIINSDLYILKINLGLTGFILLKKKLGNENLRIKRAEIEFLDRNGNSVVLYLIDSRAFGSVKIIPKVESCPPFHELKSKKGKQLFINKLLFSKQYIYKLLVDQKVAPGIGSYIAVESLFLSGYHPMKKNLSLDECELIYKNINQICNKSIKVGGNTWDNFTYPDGSVGQYYKRLKVYGRNNQNCMNCSEKILSVKILGRSIPYCDNCQKL